MNIRGLEYHISQWGDPSLVTPQRPPLLLCHGFMDIGASFQFLVDAMADHEGERPHPSGAAVASVQTRNTSNQPTDPPHLRPDSRHGPPLDTCHAVQVM